MRVYETTAHVGPDGRLRLDLPVQEKEQDVKVAVVVESQPVAPVPDDIWAPYREKLEAAGVRVPAPGTPWHIRQVEPLKIDGPPVSQTLVEDRR